MRTNRRRPLTTGVPQVRAETARGRPLNGFVRGSLSPEVLFAAHRWSEQLSPVTDGIPHGEFDCPDRAVICVDHRSAANLFDEPPDQPKPVQLAFGFGLEALAVV